MLRYTYTHPRLVEDGAAGQLDVFIEARKNILEATEAAAEEPERWSDTVFNDSLALSDDVS